MAVDPRKRQKKLERRKAKQKAERRQLARREAGGMPVRFEWASTAPILHCVKGASLGEFGIGPVLISRQLRDGTVAFVEFLLDVYCLGVKDVIMSIAPRGQYQRRMYDELAERDTLIPLKPECARKLVEGAVRYALDLGIEPHPDFRTARRIFGDIQSAACTEEFEYGKDGKPFFVAGPHDGPARCRNILHTLEDRCGPDGYHYIIPGEAFEEL